MQGCFFIGKDTSICVRFLTSEPKRLTPWIEKFQNGPCHVHLDIQGAFSTLELELKKWLDSSISASALLLLDAESKQISDSSFLELCKNSRKQGVFIGLFVDGHENSDTLVQSLQANWTLPIHASPEIMQRKVNEILGVVRFTEFTKNAA